MSEKTVFWGLVVLFLGDLAFPFVFGPFYPGYSQWHDTLSTLGNHTSPVAGVTSGWLIAFGVVGSVLGYFEIRRARRAAQPFAAAVGLVLFALGAGVIAGLFAEDLPGMAETSSGKIHGIGAGIGSLGLVIGLGLGSYRAPRGARLGAILFTAISLIGFGLFLGAKAPDSLAGLWQKIYLGAAYAGVLWIAWTQRTAAPKP